jgi:hypothetical protein
MTLKKNIKKILGRDLQDLIAKQNRTLINQNKELEWAHIYHDSIKGKKWLNILPLNIGRWAGNYSFLYVLNRILNDCKPKEILEFGLGESSKIISKYIENQLTETNHEIIEQDYDWLNSFKDNFTLSLNSTVKVMPLTKKKKNGYEFNGYENIEKHINKKYDFYLIDGPFGSTHYSRYDIVNILQNINKNDEFIIMLDDYQRAGEQETFLELKNFLASKNINIYTNIYEGNKAVAVIGTEKYKFISSL